MKKNGKKEQIEAARWLLVKSIYGVTCANSLRIKQIYESHYELAEAVLPLLPDQPDLLKRLSAIEQLLAHLQREQLVLNELQKKIENL